MMVEYVSVYTLLLGQDYFKKNRSSQNKRLGALAEFVNILLVQLLYIATIYFKIYAALTDLGRSISIEPSDSY